VSAIAYFLEAEGIATTGISLVRENTESFAPPRFLWVSFPLGRPLGVPGDATFQLRVIQAALALLDAPNGPVLEDFPEDIASTAVAEAMVCPVSFGKENATEDGWIGRLLHEVQSLAPWYQQSLDRRGRTTVGITGRSAPEVAKEIGAMLDENLEVPVTVKHLLEDLKAYYSEAMSAQPGADADVLSRWLWSETELGAAMCALRDVMQASDDDRLRVLGEAVVPRWVDSHMPE
jgi:hypothetical protein